MKYFYNLLFIILLALIAFETATSGGLIHNSNQSAAYARTLNRDATTEIDAVFYNPAGLTALQDGLFCSISNQSIFQDRTITNDYQYLNEKEFKGEASAPLYPDVFIGYKFGDFVISAGFMPIGGGGSAEYSKGLPSFHLAIADLVPALGLKFLSPVSYSTDIYFKGKSVYYGFQGGLSYKINKMISLFAGARFIMAQNNYEGHLKNTKIKIDSLKYDGKADAFFLNAANQYKTAKEQYLAAGDTVTATALGKQEAEMNIKAALLSDQIAEVEQTGTGITPILGANITLFDNKLNIGIKYELNTSLKIQNKTASDVKVGFDTASKQFITQFPDGKEHNQEIPALLTIGASYKIIDELLFSTGFHYYWDQSANWDGLEDSLDGNSIEFGLGMEYSITDDLLMSTGWLMTANGVTERYQSDMNYSLTTNSLALGGRYKIMNNLNLNLGFTYVVYDEAKKQHKQELTQMPANYTFAKSTFVFAIGFDYILGGI